MVETGKFAALPPPDAAATAHSDQLLAHVRAEIERAGGWLSFERYMALALYAPGLGYYSAGARKFGAGGDFVTAPELSPLFARCLARQCRQVLAVTGGDILELGAGSGVLAADLLDELEALGAPPRRYRILEVSAELRQRQRETLADRIPRWLDRVEWLTRLPQGVQGVILGNEVVDALPVTRFRVTADGARPLGVAWHDRLVWCEGPADPDLNERLASLQQMLGYPLPEGYVSEINRQLHGWLAALADSLARGLLLLIDYGYPRREYYHPDRGNGTLLCHYRHRVHDDPLVHPGLQDMTASVDFSTLADAGLAAGLTLAGYTSQNYFLFGCGLEELLAEADPEAEDLRRFLELTHQVKLLTLPGEMGERCKAIGFTRDLAPALRGFDFLDERSRL